jgi:hypothetical protein
VQLEGEQSFTAEFAPPDIRTAQPGPNAEGVPDTR